MRIGKGGFVLVKYTLCNTLVALTSEDKLTELPSGSIVEAPAMRVEKGVISIRHLDRVLIVLAVDFLGSAKLVPGEQE